MNGSIDCKYHGFDFGVMKVLSTKNYKYMYKALWLWLYDDRESW